MWRIHESLKYESKREVLDSIYRTYIAKQLCLKTILQLSIFIYIETYNQLEAGSVWRGH